LRVAEGAARDRWFALLVAPQPAQIAVAPSGDFAATGA